MLIIGHRGARGLAPENSLAAFDAGYEAGADILEFDIRLTKDKVPVIIHDRHTKRTHEVKTVISRTTFADLRARGYSPEIITLEKLLDKYFGKIMLNIEVKSFGSGKVVTELLANNYIKKPSDWDNTFISSFVWTELIAARRASQRVNLALLQSINPFGFLALHRRLHLTAVGFHRLHTNSFALEVAKRLKIFTYAYTVNTEVAARKLAEKGLDGICTDRPDLMVKAFEKTNDISPA